MAFGLVIDSSASFIKTLLAYFCKWEVRTTFTLNFPIFSPSFSVLYFHTSQICEGERVKFREIPFESFSPSQL